MSRTVGHTSSPRVVQINPLVNSPFPHAMPAGRLRSALDALREEGFDAVVIGGDEPLHYRDLPLVLSHARGLGMKTAVLDAGIVDAPPDTNTDELSSIADAADGLADVSGRRAPLAEILARIVILAEGAVVPLHPEVARAYQIADLNEPDLRQQFDAWCVERLPHFAALCRGVYINCFETADPASPPASWYGAVAEASQLHVPLGCGRQASRSDCAGSRRSTRRAGT